MKSNEASIKAQAAGTELINAVTTLLEILAGKSAAPLAGVVLETLGNYAWLGFSGSYEGEIDERLNEINVQVELIQGNLMLPNGSDLLGAETQELIKKVAKAAQARRKLDQGESVTTEELAALARVTERTIRAATSSKNPNAMRITKDGYWTWIQAEDALTWLRARKDYVSTTPLRSGPSVLDLQVGASPGETWAKWRRNGAHSVEDFVSSLKWSSEQAELYQRVEQDDLSIDTLRLSPKFWLELATHLGAQEPAHLAAATSQMIATRLVSKQVSAELTPKD